MHFRLKRLFFSFAKYYKLQKSFAFSRLIPIYQILSIRTYICSKTMILLFNIMLVGEFFLHTFSFSLIVYVAIETFLKAHAFFQTIKRN